MVAVAVVLVVALAGLSGLAGGAHAPAESESTHAASVLEPGDPDDAAADAGHARETPTAGHGEDNETYRLATSNTWATSELEILIVPPVHGPIASTEEGALPEGAEGAAPGGAYLEATLHALSDWEHLFETTGELAAGEDPPGWAADIGWIEGVSLDVRIVSEDVLTPEDVQEADVVKFYHETSYPVVGLTAYAEPCVAYSTMWLDYGSLTYEDMYKVAGHELGHCLGSSHPESFEGDLMSQGGYPQASLRCPSNLDARSIAASFAGAFDAPTGPSAGATASIEAHRYEQFCGEPPRVDR